MRTGNDIRMGVQEVVLDLQLVLVAPPVVALAQRDEPAMDIWHHQLSYVVPLRKLVIGLEYGNNRRVFFCETPYTVGSRIGRGVIMDHNLIAERRLLRRKAFEALLDVAFLVEGHADYTDLDIIFT